MEPIKFYIPYPPQRKMPAFCKAYGLNAIYAGKHWSKRKEDSQYWHMLVQNELRRQGIPRKIFERPVGLHFWWNDRMDCSNHAYIGKMIEDAIKGHIIQDDSRRWVKSIMHSFHDRDYIQVDVYEV